MLYLGCFWQKFNSKQMFPGHHFLRAVIYYLTQNSLFLIFRGFFTLHDLPSKILLKYCKWHTELKQKSPWVVFCSCRRDAGDSSEGTVAPGCTAHPKHCTAAERMTPEWGFSAVHRNEDSCLFFCWNTQNIFCRRHKSALKELQLRAWCFAYTIKGVFSHIYSRPVSIPVVMPAWQAASLL